MHIVHVDIDYTNKWVVGICATTLSEWSIYDEDTDSIRYYDTYKEEYVDETDGIRIFTNGERINFVCTTIINEYYEDDKLLDFCLQLLRIAYKDVMRIGENYKDILKYGRDLGEALQFCFIKQSIDRLDFDKLEEAFEEVDGIQIKVL